MTPEQIENLEIWKKVKGAEKLLEIYTYFPGFHDAQIKKVDIGFADKSFCLMLDYYDFIDNPDNIIFTRTIICWRDIRKADFNWGGQDLYGMKFSREEDFVKTKFADFSSGFYGEIVAGEVEVADVEVEPADKMNSEYQAVKFLMK